MMPLSELSIVLCNPSMTMSNATLCTLIMAATRSSHAQCQHCRPGTHDANASVPATVAKFTFVRFHLRTGHCSNTNRRPLTAGSVACMTIDAAVARLTSMCAEGDWGVSMPDVGWLSGVAKPDALSDWER